MSRPRKFDTAEELQSAINEYFKLLKVKDEEKDTSEHFDSSPTITGLAYFLGFSDRHSFYDYEKNKEFSHTIKRARTRVENWYEQGLSSGSATGNIFALKNFGWKDKHEVTQETKTSGTLSIEIVEDTKE